MSCAITNFGNKFCFKKRSRLIRALDKRFYVKFMQFEMRYTNLSVANCQLRVVSYELRVDICQLRVASWQLIFVSCQLRVVS